MSKTRQLTISQTTKGRLPRLPFVDIKNVVLGKKYELSLVFIGDARSQKLNKIYRKKNKPANVLSFPLSKSEGEIFINSRHAQKEARGFDMSTTQFIGYLFIHGLLHLEGHTHGSIMEEAEMRLLKKFKIKT